MPLNTRIEIVSDFSSQEESRLKNHSNANQYASKLRAPNAKCQWMTSISTVGGGEIFIKRELFLKNMNYFLTIQSFDVMSDSSKNMYYNHKATSLFTYM